MRILRINKRYEVEGGAITPRSHFHKLERYDEALVQCDYVSTLTGAVVTEIKLFTRPQLKRVLGLKKGMELEIE